MFVSLNADNLIVIFWKNKQKGSALTEAAIVLPILLMVTVIGIPTFELSHKELATLKIVKEAAERSSYYAKDNEFTTGEWSGIITKIKDDLSKSQLNPCPGEDINTCLDARIKIYQCTNTECTEMDIVNLPTGETGIDTSNAKGIKVGINFSKPCASCNMVMLGNYENKEILSEIAPKIGS